MSASGLIVIDEGPKPNITEACMIAAMPVKDCFASNFPEPPEWFLRDLANMSERHGIAPQPSGASGLEVRWDPWRHHFFIVQWSPIYNLEKGEYEWKFSRVFDCLYRENGVLHAIVPLDRRALHGLEEARVLRQLEIQAKREGKPRPDFQREASKKAWDEKVEKVIAPQIEADILRPMRDGRTEEAKLGAPKPRITVPKDIRKPRWQK